MAVCAGTDIRRVENGAGDIRREGVGSVDRMGRRGGRETVATVAGGATRVHEGRDITMAMAGSTVRAPLMGRRFIGRQIIEMQNRRTVAGLANTGTGSVGEIGPGRAVAVAAADDQHRAGIGPHPFPVGLVADQAGIAGKATVGGRKMDLVVGGCMAGLAEGRVCGRTTGQHAVVRHTVEVVGILGMAGITGIGRIGTIKRRDTAVTGGGEVGFGGSRPAHDRQLASGMTGLAINASRLGPDWLAVGVANGLVAVTGAVAVVADCRLEVRYITDSTVDMAGTSDTIVGMTDGAGQLRTIAIEDMALMRTAEELTSRIMTGTAWCPANAAVPIDSGITALAVGVTGNSTRTGGTAVCGTCGQVSGAKAVRSIEADIGNAIDVRTADCTGCQGGVSGRRAHMADLAGIALVQMGGVRNGVVALGKCHRCGVVTVANVAGGDGPGTIGPDRCGGRRLIGARAVVDALAAVAVTINGATGSGAARIVNRAHVAIAGSQPIQRRTAKIEDFLELAVFVACMAGIVSIGAVALVASETVISGGAGRVRLVRGIRLVLVNTGSIVVAYRRACIVGVATLVGVAGKADGRRETVATAATG